ncbi:hypothetical protein ACHAXT_007078 [Thalassiosira profunda]
MAAAVSPSGAAIVGYNSWDDSSTDAMNDSSSTFSFLSESSLSSSSSDDEDEAALPREPSDDSLRSPSVRKARTRTVQVSSPLKHVASSEKVRRNTDSMLEDAFIADRLKRRLGSRREQAAGRTIAYTGLSDFIIKSIMEGSLDAISAALPTDESLSNAANIAFHACMSGYFSNLKDDTVIRKLKHIFMESLERVEFQQGDHICRQNEQVDKLFVVEEGMVQFSCEGQVAGTAGMGSILGELSLVYGIPAPSDVECITPCAIVWSMDALSYRRIQAVVAKESLRSREGRIQLLQRQCSSFLDLQEESKRSESNQIPLDQLERIAIIGKGAFGSVYIVEDKGSPSADQRFLSLKCMSKASIVQRGNEKRVLIEKHALQASDKSPFVISLLGTYQDRDSIYFLTDFVQGGNLMGHMINRDVLPHDECVFFCANLVAGLAFLHTKGFVHRDVKPENCLIGKDGYLRLCDFGMAKRLPSTVQLPSGGTEVVTLAFTMCGTPEFMAPEFVLSTGYSKGIDWWALGCILVEMYSGKSPFEYNGDLKETFKKVCLIGMGRESFVPPKELEQAGLQDARNFAQQLLSKASDRLGRLNSCKVRHHPYFAGIDFDRLQQRRVKPPYIPSISHAADASHFDVGPEDREKITRYTGSDEPFRDF